MENWLLIENTRVVDGLANEANEDVTVAVEGNRIRWIGDGVPEDILPRGIDLTRIDGRGHTVMPGLIDAHCHISFGEAQTQEQQDLYTPVELRTLRSAASAQKILRAGVTSISSPGGSYNIGVGVREGIRERMVQGPRIASAGRFVTTSNGLSDFYPTSVGVPDGSIGVLTNTPDEMLREVRLQIKNGVDFVKLADSPYGDFQAFRDNEVELISGLCHQLGKQLTIHARGPNELIAAVNAGCDWIMHGNIMSDEGIELLAASKIPLIPTILLQANFVDFGEQVGAPRGAIAGSKRLLEHTYESLHKAHAAGAVLGMGTDSGFAITPFGEWHARELELLMRYAGMTALEAIRAGTSALAVTMHMEGELGVVAPGYLADLLVVAGDPDEDIRLLQDRRNIVHVILDGEVVVFDEEELATRRPFDPSKHLTQGVLTYHSALSDSGLAASHALPFSEEKARDILSDMATATDKVREAAHFQD